MEEAFIKERLIAYAEELITPALVEEIHKEDTINDEHGDTTVWEVACDNGEMYWLLEGDMPTNIYKKCGIYSTIKNVYEAYIDMFEQAPLQVEMADRFQYR